MPIELNQRLDVLHSYLNSVALGVDGRIWVLCEIWDIQIDHQLEQQKASTAMETN